MCSAICKILKAVDHVHICWLKANLLYQTGMNFDFTSSQKSVHGADGYALNLLNLLMVAKMMSRKQ
jgi:hypothetical protein